MSMRTTLKLSLLLAVCMSVVSLAFDRYQAERQRSFLRQDLVMQAEVLADSLQETIEPLFEQRSSGAIQHALGRFSARPDVHGIAVYDPTGPPVTDKVASKAFLKEQPSAASRAVAQNSAISEFLKVGDVRLFVYAVPLHRAGRPTGSLAVVLDAANIDERLAGSMKTSLANAAVQVLLTVPIVLLLVRWTYADPVARMTRWLQSLRVGGSDEPPNPANMPALGKLQEEVTFLARDLGAARATAEHEARLRESQVSLWTAERLRVSLAKKLQSRPVFVVANREPYMHILSPEGPKMLVPASGLVTALEPVLLACDGTWVAHGSGDADRLVVDSHDRLRVPPDRPRYTLRRVWMTDEQERGYYYGFANEGLWPLCHIAHTRPVFRPEDWAHYQEVNQIFADAVLAEMKCTTSPIVLVQDYHFALLPRLVKSARPDARVAIFWHVPWPNPEVFGICPFARELVDGLLGADLVGFHTQALCNNFLSSVDRAVEALTEWDRFAVTRLGHTTCVRPYPISVAFPEAAPPSRELSGRESAERQALCDELGIDSTMLIVGVDRVDYTKGILERFRAVERLLDSNPEFQGRVTLAQIGAPSRTQIDRYQRFLDEVTAEAERINARFRRGRWKPIAWLNRHHSHSEITRFLHAASVCLVTSLHDGMNLVSKEFVAARDDERGVLVLSTFAGAALELTDALLVNPYDVQQVASAIRRALEMSDEDQRDRMRRMRHNVRENNIYKWAANLMNDLADVRVEPREPFAAA
jgi:trehalose 6-phosphate synthase